ncbi:hypothetical protein HBI56_152990 [Parastagonospora nodorum]|uniref:Glycosyltransferase family 8 protein n=2 Tax=Phaeosphaeria nodorum (strain SN15 / ATCC MYA-4574 / FGSC 10173) TaxID=321614 RepID=A0A7U2FFF2_PHANO|nr:hypothetical protein HBH56_181510 [Parastagonospora nodorum]QRD04268.1 hypothetical protein JI435_130000 [Parastagonospora nodorum SN15]KAH3926212.1 hypothetical protein HBH54_170660 [Parastagonospora nodorum]KAH3944890.1 hypothetical protein HBH53_154260 [Parastagonospora nodorum]KAH3960561.1 hypothetical protein HBH52_235740 [Parastagonospora nodorum]
MGRLLLSSSQVSVILSAVIIFMFTFALFLSGYVLQQRYVHNLQAAIKPRLPKPLVQQVIEPPKLDVKWARPMGSRPDLDDSYQQYIAGQTMDWSRLGYVQMVKERVELCSAVMLLSDLHRMKSPARKILMFPRLWLAEAEETKKDPQTATTWRLLRTAARRYGVTLVPMEPIVDGADANLASSYSLASIYSLAEFERVVYLQGPGTLLDASALDSMLAFSKSETIAAFPASPERKELSTSLLLVHPSKDTFQQLKAQRASASISDLELFRATFPASESLIADWTLSRGNLYYESQSLREPVDEFNATAFEESTTYVRLSDPELPGPEYDVPYSDRVRLRPKNREAEEVWSRLYEDFRQQRMDVCGLDLEYMPVVLDGLLSKTEAETEL